MNNFIKYLQGADLRSISDVDQLLPLIKNQNDFNQLFSLLYSDDRLLITRTADAIEKITRDKSLFLNTHKGELIKFMENANDKEFKWHLALLSSRLWLTSTELEHVWRILTRWAKNKKESKIVRVNSLQALYELTSNYHDLKRDFDRIVEKLERENVASLNARIRRLR